MTSGWPAREFELSYRLQESSNISYQLSTGSGKQNRNMTQAWRMIWEENEQRFVGQVPQMPRNNKSRDGESFKENKHQGNRRK